MNTKFLLVVVISALPLPTPVQAQSARNAPPQACGARYR